MSQTMTPRMATFATDVATRATGFNCALLTTILSLTIARESSELPEFPVHSCKRSTSPWC